MLLKPVNFGLARSNKHVINAANKTTVKIELRKLTVLCHFVSVVETRVAEKRNYLITNYNYIANFLDRPTDSTHLLGKTSENIYMTYTLTMTIANQKPVK